jgi:uncharacterized iron-regulated membrane protein
VITALLIVTLVLLLGVATGVLLVVAFKTQITDWLYRRG